jgi:WD40 repeat protein
VLRALVRGQAKPSQAKHTAPLTRFPEGTPERTIIDALLAPDMRLLIAEGDGEGAQIYLAHEALITNWERARRQVARDADDFRLLQTIEEAEAEYRAAPKHEKNGCLLRDPRLANAMSLAARWKDELAPELRAFIAQSEDANKAATRRRWAIAVAVMVCLAVLTAASLAAFYVAESERNDALIVQSRILARDSRDSTGNGAAVLGARLALAALPRDLRSPDRPFVPEAEAALVYAMANQRERMVFSGHEPGPFPVVVTPDPPAAVSAGTLAMRPNENFTMVQGLNKLPRIENGMVPGAVLTAAFSPDDGLILTGATDHTARVWDRASGKVIHVLRGHQGAITSAAFSPDGKQILTVAMDNTARLWDAQKGESILRVRSKSKNYGFNHVAFSANGTRAVISDSAGSATVIDFRSRSVVELDGHAHVVVWGAFSPDGSRVVTASYDKTARIWDAATGAPIKTLAGHQGAVNMAMFSPDGSQVLTASSDGTARIWNSETGDPIRVLTGHVDEVNTAVFSPDGKRIVTASYDATARIWEIASDKAKILRGHESSVLSAVFSRDGALVLTSSSDKTSRLWDTQFGRSIGVLGGHGDGITSAAFSHDNAYVLTGSRDNTARLWQVVPLPPFASLASHPDSVNVVSFSSDGQRLLTQSRAAVRLRNALSSADILKLDAQDQIFTFATLSKDGALLLIATTDNTARLFDAVTGAPRELLQGHAKPITRAEFSRDGSRILTVSDDKTARLWNVGTEGPLSVLAVENEEIKSATFSSDGRRILSVSNSSSQLWDGNNGILIATLDGRRAAFSPDAKRILTVTSNGTARFWSSETGAAGTILKGDDHRINAAEFSPDGKQVLTVSNDNTARLWSTDAGRPIDSYRVDDGISYAHYSPDGKRILVGNDRYDLLLDANTGTVIARLRAGSLGFSPDSRFLFFITNSNTPWLWDGRSGAQIGELLAENGAINTQAKQYAFSPDSALLAIPEEERRMRIWRLLPSCQALLDFSRSQQLRELSVFERQKVVVQRSSHGPLIDAYTSMRPWISLLIPNGGDRC